MQQTTDNVNALNARLFGDSREEGEHRDPNTYQVKGTTMTSIVDQTPDMGEFFDSLLTVDARFAGGTITLEPEFVDWLGETLVKLDIPGLTSPLALRTYEARDLAKALLNQAAHIDEDERPDPLDLYEPRPCTDPNCREDSHEWLNGEIAEAHALEPIENAEHGYRVHGDRTDGGMWEVWVDTHDLPDGPTLGRAVQCLADDIERMQHHIERLNGQHLERRTEPGQPQHEEVVC